MGGVLGEASDLMEESGIYERLAEQLAEAAVQRIAWAVSFFLVGILLCVLIHVLDVVARLPVLDRVNRMGGLAVGLLQGLVVVWILFFVIDLLWAGSAGAQIMGSIHENAFLEFLYENNPIERFALGIFGR